MFNIMNSTMLSNHHIIQVMSNSPKTNSTKRVDEKRGRAWPVEKIKQKRSKTGNVAYASLTSCFAHTQLK